MRVKGGYTTRRRRKKVLKRAKGYFGSKHALFRTAREQLLHSGQYAFNSRKQLKRDFRALWILRINNACRLNNTRYKDFIYWLKQLKIKINRKMLSEIALHDADLFTSLVQQVKNKLKIK
ncbi:MAG: 50S ribosomal protein L20 [Bacilli bacterium]|nr:50S ribosomal protein L20 [Bacilli bacterium]